MGHGQYRLSSRSSPQFTDSFFLPTSRGDGANPGTPESNRLKLIDQGGQTLFEIESLGRGSRPYDWIVQSLTCSENRLHLAQQWEQQPFERR